LSSTASSTGKRCGRISRKAADLAIVRDRRHQGLDEASSFPEDDIGVGDRYGFPGINSLHGTAGAEVCQHDGGVIDQVAEHVGFKMAEAAAGTRPNSHISQEPIVHLETSYQHSTASKRP
jgi:hypothetical protein